MEHVEICIRGRIDQDWSNWLNGLSVTYTAEGDTVLIGSVRDQSVLFGLLDRLSDLGMQLASVTSTGQIQADRHEASQELQQQ